MRTSTGQSGGRTLVAVYYSHHSSLNGFPLPFQRCEAPLPLSLSLSFSLLEFYFYSLYYLLEFRVSRIRGTFSAFRYLLRMLGDVRLRPVGFLSERKRDVGYKFDDLRFC